VVAAALSERGPLQPREAEGLLMRLRQQSEARLRVVAPDGRILADSSRLGPRLEGDADAASRPPPVRDDPLYPAGAWLYRQAERIVGAPPPNEPEAVEPSEPTDVVSTPEVRAALGGRYGARTRASPGGRRSMTLFSALPVWNGGQVVGAVEVSQSTTRLFRALDQTRLGGFKVFLASVAVAAGFGLLLSTPLLPPPPRARAASPALLPPRRPP